MNKIALFSMAVGKDPVYFDSVRRYFPYNKKYFEQNHSVDYFLFTDRNDTIDGVTIIPCKTTTWPYTALLKNNIIADYLEIKNNWDAYTHIFFIDADFAIGDYYDFFSPDFFMVKPYWNDKGGGFFYGGKTEYFRKLCFLFFEEIQFIYDNKLALPRDLDEFYLGLFRIKFHEHIRLIEMNRQTNTLIFYDNENLDEKIKQQGNRLFMQPYKAEGRANKTYVIDKQNKRQECIVNLNELYIFNNYTYDFGRLLKIDESHYRIFWNKHIEDRDVLNIEIFKIWQQLTNDDIFQPSPVLSIIMPVHRAKPEHLKECIDSILNQTFNDFELLMPDTVLMDLQNSVVIKSYTDPRIRLIACKSDFNECIDESKGKYIVRMDADSIMLPNRLQMQYDFMEMHPETDVCGSWMEITENQRRTAKMPVEHKQIISLFLLANPMVDSTVVLRKASVCRVGQNLYKGSYFNAEDYKLWTVLAVQGYRFANIPEILVKCRNIDTLSGIKLEQKNQNFLKVRMEYAEKIMEQMVKKDSDCQLFFDELITLFNRKTISPDTLLKTVYSFYSSHLLCI